MAPETSSHHRSHPWWGTAAPEAEGSPGAFFPGTYVHCSSQPSSPKGRCCLKPVSRQRISCQPATVHGMSEKPG